MTLEALIQVHELLSAAHHALRTDGDSSFVAADARVTILRATELVETLIGRAAIPRNDPPTWVTIR